MAHRSEPCEICWIVKVLRSENVHDDEVVREVGDTLARVSRGCIADIALPLARASLHTECRAGGHDDTCRARLVVRRCVREKRYEGKLENLSTKITQKIDSQNRTSATISPDSGANVTVDAEIRFSVSVRAHQEHEVFVLSEINNEKHDRRAPPSCFETRTERRIAS